MVAALPEGMLRERWLPWKAGLYNLEMISPQGCNFQMGGLAYDKAELLKLWLSFMRK